jgi:hydrogenase/urease accessory protein HupE
MEMNLAQYVTAGFVLIGLVNGIQFALDKNWRSFAFFMVAVIAGTTFGFLGWFSLPSAEIGLAIGISSSGAYKVAQKFGGV